MEKSSSELRQRPSTAAAGPKQTEQAEAEPAKKAQSPLMMIAEKLSALTETQQYLLLLVGCLPFAVAVVYRWRQLGVI